MSGRNGRPVRFVVIGLASTGLYFAFLLGLRPLIASTAALAALCYALSMAFNYAAQGLWTFGIARLSKRSLGRYTVVQGGALTTNAVVMGGLVDWFGLPLLPSQIMVTGLVAIGVYCLSALWVYR